MGSILGDTLAHLWNGGLHPETADAGELRARRTLGATIIGLSPLIAALMAANFYTGSAEDNPVIGGALVIMLTALFVQADGNRPLLAAHMALGAFYGATLITQLDTGMSGYGWVWGLSLPAIAMLVAGRAAALFWGLAMLLLFWSFALMEQSGVEFSRAPLLASDGVSLAVEASLLLALFVAAPMAFRSAQADAERRMRGSLEALSREVEERRRAEAAARAAEAAKAAFLAAMSHELRTPLNGVLGAVQLLREQPLDADARRLVGVMNESSDLLLELIDNVLDLSRLDGRGVELERAPLALAELVRGVLAPLELQAQRKGVALSVSVAEDVPEWILGDAVRLRQVLVNLVGNALKFTPAGRIDVTATRRADALLLRVRDTGIGIPEEALPTLFEPYVQAGEAASRRFGGSGLGLAIVHRLVRAMSGDIAVTSTPGRGTVFEVTLPIEEASAPQVGASGAPERSISRNVLVVDDNAVNRMVVTRMLARLGHVASEATDGAEAVEAVARERPDVVLMDLAMPGMDGYAAIRAIRALPGPEAETEILALTAHALTEDRERVFAAGGNGFLTKPVRLEAIAQALAPPVDAAVSADAAPEAGSATTRRTA